METLKFDKNRNKAKYCPCNRNNRDGKFAPYKGYINKGYCFSCGKVFLPEKENIVEPFQNKKKPIKPPSYHPLELVKKSGRNFKQNYFIQFLKILFSEEEVKNAILKYLIGTSDHWNGATVFWQIDHRQKVRHGKIMLYNSNTGKRTKNPHGKAYINSIRSTLKLRNFNLKQCLFGLHLINETEIRTVAIVEGEKTAVIMSVFKPEYVWLATGSKQGFKYEILKPLKGYNIVAFPDKSEYNDWQTKARELSNFGFNISVSDFLEDSIYPEGTDLVDVFIKNSKNKYETKLSAKKVSTPAIVRTKAENMALKLANINPALRKLIKVFELTDNNGIPVNI